MTIEDQIRDAQATVVRMTLARNAVRAKIVAARAAPTADPSGNARLAGAQRQYLALRDGAREALGRLAELTAQSRAARRG
jgi:hypothetical protein